MGPSFLAQTSPRTSIEIEQTNFKSRR